MKMTPNVLDVKHTDDFYQKIVIPITAESSNKPWTVRIRNNREIFPIEIKKDEEDGRIVCVKKTHDGRIFETPVAYLYRPYYNAPEFKNRVLSFLGEGATASDLIDDSKGRNYTHINVGMYFSFCLTRQDIVRVVGLAANKKILSMWQRQMGQFGVIDILDLPNLYDEFVPNVLTKKIVGFTEKYGRPPLPGRMFGRDFPDEILSETELSFNIFRKTIPLFGNVDVDEGETIRAVGYRQWGSLEIVDEHRLFSLPVGQNGKLWNPRDNFFTDIDFLRRNLSLDADISKTEDVRERALYFYAANHSYNDYIAKKKTYNVQAAFPTGLLMEGILSKGRFDLKEPTPSMIRDFFDNTNQMPEIFGVPDAMKRQKMVDIRCDAKTYSLAEVKDDGSIRPFAERFLLGGRHALQKEKVLAMMREKGFSR